MTEHSETVEQTEPRNWLFWGVKWYGYVIAAMFLLYGGLKLVLGALDRDYKDVPTNVIFLLAGLVLFGIALAFRDRKTLGWYCLVGLNGLVVLVAAVTITNMYSIPYLILSGAALAALFSKVVKGEFF